MSDPPTPRTAADIWVRLPAVFALDASIGVIFRRGPRYHHQMVLWDTKTDTFTPGQWMTGHASLGSISPDGRYVIYIARQISDLRRRRWRALAAAANERTEGASAYDPLTAPIRVRQRGRRRVPRYMRPDAHPVREPFVRPEFGAWTAISRPPWFSALAIWPLASSYGGGGYVGRDGTIVLGHPPEERKPIVNAQPIPSRLKINTDGDPAERATSGYWRDWLASCRRPISYGDEYVAWRKRVMDGGARFLDWVDLSDPITATFAADGTIRRIGLNEAAKTNVDVIASSEILADFNGTAFETIPPSAEAMTW